MYNIIFQTHKISVFLFLFLYVVKTILLVAGKNEQQDKVTKITKVPEMIISTLFLISGIYMAFNYPFIGMFFYIKIACVFISIPVAVIGFKKKNKVLGIISLVLIFGAYGLAEVNKARVKRSLNVSAETLDAPVTASSSKSKSELGKSLYEKGCQVCHGSNGDAGVAGAANLKISKLTEAETYQIIKNGKNTMPKFNSLSDSELETLISYLATLR